MSEKETTEVKKTTRRKKVEEPKPEEQVEPEVAEQESVSDSDTESDRFYYIGPSIARFGLVENMTLLGSRQAVEKYCKNAIGSIAGFKQLIVSSDEFVKMKNKKEAGGNSLTNLYNKVKELR